MSREEQPPNAAEIRRQLVEMLGWWETEIFKAGPLRVPGQGSWENFATLVRTLGKIREFKVDRAGGLAKVIRQVDREYPKLGLLEAVEKCYQRLLRHPPAPHLRILALASDAKFSQCADLLQRVAGLVEAGSLKEGCPTPEELRRIYFALSRLKTGECADWVAVIQAEYARSQPAAYSEAGFRESLGFADAILARLWLAEMAADEREWWILHTHSRGLAQEFAYAGWPNAVPELSGIFPHLIAYDYQRPASVTAAAAKLRKRKQRGRERVIRARKRQAGG